MRKGQRAVTIASVVIAIASLALYLFYRIHSSPAPLWVKVALAYGLVFCVFLWFDKAAKSVAESRNNRRSAAVTRPRPGPGTRPGQTVAIAPSVEVAKDVRIVRVVDRWDGFSAHMAAFAEELAALDGTRLTIAAASENEPLTSVAAWTEQSNRHPFDIVAGEEVCGSCGVEVNAAGEARLLAFYIDVAWRRRRLGQAALARLGAFLDLAGANTLTAVISPNNHRAGRFLRHCGFQDVLEAAKVDNPEQAQEVRLSWRLGNAQNSI